MYLFQFLKIITSACVVFFLASCNYELSPWETDVNCPNRSVTDNLAWLKTVEQEKQLGDTFKVAVIGDPQQFPQDLEETIDALNEMDDIDFILLLGDLVETGVKQEFEWTCKALSHTNKPIMPVVGNHDALSYGKDIWLATFGEFNYSFSYLGTKFIAYNDNQYEFKDVPDRDYLAQQAALDDGEIRNHTIGMSHIAPWGRDPDLSEYLESVGFEHMLHAHTHKFSYYQKSGVNLPHFITASTQDVKFAIMTVTPQALNIEECDPVCLPANLTTR